ncbi:hypothetical protein PhiBTCVTUL1a_27 [Burkholderia phage phiBtTUL1a]|nr:hypothetical protein PhiBTCVTUL1a_27 [Burkholderia phage phiBtTUL1a]
MERERLVGLVRSVPHVGLRERREDEHVDVRSVEVAAGPLHFDVDAPVVAIALHLHADIAGRDVVAAGREEHHGREDQNQKQAFHLFSLI